MKMKKASFTLYEDEGENQDYLKGIFSLTYIVCTTVSSGFNIDISPEDKGFHQSDKRNFVLSILTDKNQLRFPSTEMRQHWFR